MKLLGSLLFSGLSAAQATELDVYTVQCNVAMKRSSQEPCRLRFRTSCCNKQL